jgi:alpha-aminoadipate carrier protein LysW
MSTATTMECPVCAGSVDVGDDVMLSELLDCQDCGSELEVSVIEPAVQIAEAPMCAEDWGQ